MRWGSHGRTFSLGRPQCDGGAGVFLDVQGCLCTWQPPQCLARATCTEGIVCLSLLSTMVCASKGLLPWSLAVPFSQLISCLCSQLRLGHKPSLPPRLSLAPWTMGSLLQRGWGTAGSCPCMLLTPGSPGHPCPRMTCELGCSLGLIPVRSSVSGLQFALWHFTSPGSLRFQILVVLFSHKSHSESDPESMTSFVFSVKTILFKSLGAFDFFFPEGISH